MVAGEISSAVVVAFRLLFCFSLKLYLMATAKIMRNRQIDMIKLRIQLISLVALAVNGSPLSHKVS